MYWIHFEVPVFTRLLEVNDDFFIGKLEFLEGDGSAVGIWAEVVCVESDLGMGPVLSLVAAAHCGVVGELVDVCVSEGVCDRSYKWGERLPIYCSKTEGGDYHCWLMRGWVLPAADASPLGEAKWTLASVFRIVRANNKPRSHGFENAIYLFISLPQRNIPDG